MKKQIHPKIHGLYTICDNTFSPQYTHLELADFFLKGGAKIIQLRIKNAEEAKVREIAQSILQKKKEYDFDFILNDYVEIALELEVDGIHVGENDMPIAEIKKLIGNRRFKPIVGYSSHSIEEAKLAERAGADYIAFGAIFPTKTKGPGHPVQGLEKLKKLVEEISVPTVAIGGITKENIGSVLETGVHAVAMITALTQTEDVERATREFLKNFSNYQIF